MEDADHDEQQDAAPSELFQNMFAKMRVKDGDDDRAVLSKKLSYVLRHGAKDLDLEMNADGFVQVADLLAVEMFFKGVTLEFLQDVVEQSNVDKSRYELIEESGAWLIRATGKHTISELKPSTRDTKTRRPRGGQDGGPSGGSGRQRNVQHMSEDEFCQRWRLDRLARVRLGELPPSSRQIAMQRFNPVADVPPADYPKVFVAFCKRFRGKGGKDEDGEFEDDDDWASPDHYSGGKGKSSPKGSKNKSGKGRSWDEDRGKSRGWDEERGWEEQQQREHESRETGRPGRWKQDSQQPPKNGLTLNSTRDKETERSERLIQGDFYGTLSSLFPSPGASPRTSDQGGGPSAASTAVTATMPPAAMNMAAQQQQGMGPARQGGGRMELCGWPSQPPAAPPPPPYAPQVRAPQNAWAPPPPMHAPHGHPPQGVSMQHQSMQHHQVADWSSHAYAGQSYQESYQGEAYHGGAPNHYGGHQQQYGGESYHTGYAHDGATQQWNGDAYRGGASWGNARAPQQQGARVGPCF